MSDIEVTINHRLYSLRTLPEIEVVYDYPATQQLKLHLYFLELPEDITESFIKDPTKRYNVFCRFKDMAGRFVTINAIGVIEDIYLPIDIKFYLFYIEHQNVPMVQIVEVTNEQTTDSN